MENNGSGLPHSNRVTQASGMVAVQADCTCAQALVLMGDRATVSHKSLDEIAVSVLGREIRFCE